MGGGFKQSVSRGRPSSFGTHAGKSRFTAKRKRRLRTRSDLDSRRQSQMSHQRMMCPSWGGALRAEGQNRIIRRDYPHYNSLRCDVYHYGWLKRFSIPLFVATSSATQTRHGLAATPGRRPMLPSGSRLYIAVSLGRRAAAQAAPELPAIPGPGRSPFMSTSKATGSR